MHINSNTQNDIPKPPINQATNKFIVIYLKAVSTELVPVPSLKEPGKAHDAISMQRITFPWFF